MFEVSRRQNQEVCECYYNNALNGNNLSPSVTPDLSVPNRFDE